jgi:spermidine/putrescine transport system permease protein
MGSLIGSYFAAYDWHNGSMIALILLLIILIFTLFTNKYEDEDGENRGGALL